MGDFVAETAVSSRTEQRGNACAYAHNGRNGREKAGDQLKIFTDRSMFFGVRVSVCGAGVTASKNAIVAALEVANCGRYIDEEQEEGGYAFDDPIPRAP